MANYKITPVMEGLGGDQLENPDVAKKNQWERNRISDGLVAKMNFAKALQLALDANVIQQDEVETLRKNGNNHDLLSMIEAKGVEAERNFADKVLAKLGRECAQFGRDLKALLG